MTLHGRIHNGRIILDDPAPLPEGAEVRVDVIESPAPAAAEGPTLYERLSSVVGKGEGMPADLSEHHDRYLYGQEDKAE